ncbi:hypothetical protein AB0C29_28850 [Actinoplanes sp. NPDC048791]|uniref:hypothetical protein n=1 Tax=Actinoplanes sp. NPDC048791 TaxID=3154623 RepID=UPI0034003B64
MSEPIRVPEVLMVVNVTRSGKAPPGAADPHSAHAGRSSAPPRAGEQFLAVPLVGAAAVRKKDAKTPGLELKHLADGCRTETTPDKNLKERLA